MVPSWCNKSVDPWRRSAGPFLGPPSRRRRPRNALLGDVEIPAKRPPPGAGRARVARGGGTSSVQPGLRGAAARRLVMEAARAKARLPANPPSFPGPERARSRGPMGDRGLRRAEAGAASPRAFAATGSVLPCGNVQIRGCGRSARSARGGRPLPSRKDASPRMRSLYRYTLCKRNIQQRADTARPPVVPVSHWGFEGRSGNVGAADRPAERAFGRRGEELVPLRGGGSPLSDRWTGPGGTRTDEPREKASFPGGRGPQGPGFAGGRHN